MEDEMNKIEESLKVAFSGLSVHSIELMVNAPTEWADLSAPHRYRWTGGKLYSVSYDLNDNGRAILTEVVRTAKQNDDRMIPLEDLRAFMRPHMQNTLPPYRDKFEEERMVGYRKCLCDLMTMLDIETSASKESRDSSEKMYGKRKK
jgi:hypothetical protein